MESEQLIKLRSSLEKEKEKRDNAEKKIKKIENEIQKLELEDKAEKFSMLEIVLDEKGIDFNEILNAIETGNVDKLKLVKEVKEVTS